MLRKIKRLLIPFLATTSALVIFLCFLFSVNYGPREHEIITVYCVSQATRTGNVSDLTIYSYYSYDEKGRFLEIRKDNGNSVETYSYDEMGNPTHYPYDGGYVDVTYDENGNVLTYKRHDPDFNEPHIHEEYTYDASGKRTKTLVFFNGLLYTTKNHTYDENGNLIETLSYHGDELKEITKYIYDETGKHVISYQEYTINDSVISLDRYIDFDENGNQISYMEYWNGELRQHSTRQYDNAGRLIVSESMLVGYNGKAESKKEYEYDFAGRLIKSKIHSYGDDVLVERPTAFTYSEIDYEYDFFGNLVKETRTSENQVTSVREWSYDYKGNLVSYSLSNTLMKWYYDIHGNIIKEEYIVDGDVRITTEYTYKSFKVTRKEAEFIKTQQEEIILLPRTDATPETPTVEELIS